MRFVGAGSKSSSAAAPVEIEDGGDDGRILMPDVSIPRAVMSARMVLPARSSAMREQSRTVRAGEAR